ncbi:Lrp/AsnC family transcriptional regulator [Microbacterium soli]|uniref:Lrp/AsnC family transcriptional regulator n=1 Tax=Microbacterium soli TaxID=446075 RepID=A0ABP7N482_9MICO
MDFDAELIRALQEDGRASIRSLAVRVGRPRAVVARRLREMLSERTVRVVAAVDPALLGQHVLAHVSLRIDGAVDRVAARLGAMPETVLVSAVGGRYDMVIEVRVGTVAELHDLLGRIRTLPEIRDINTLIYTSVLKGFFVSAYRGQLRPDEIDTAIIELLQQDGRMTLRALGESVRLSASAVSTRLQKLLDAGVITISTVEARGLEHRQLSMGVGMTLSGDDDAVLDALRAHRGIDFAARTLGRFDAIATLVEPSTGTLHDTLEHIRRLPGVTATESWLHLAVLKEDYARTLQRT